MPGELFDPTDPANPQVSSDRYAFFSAVRKCVPEMFYALRDCALTEYRAARLGSLQTSPEHLESLARKLREWATNYNLADNTWVCGLAGLCLWC
jgi:hypothetical protein